MRGAQRRAQALRGLAWDNAIMARDGVKPPEREAFTGQPVQQEPVTDEQIERQWRAYVAATEARGGSGDGG